MTAAGYLFFFLSGSGRSDPLQQAHLLPPFAAGVGGRGLADVDEPEARGETAVEFGGRAAEGRSLGGIFLRGVPWGEEKHGEQVAAGAEGVGHRVHVGVALRGVDGAEAGVFPDEVVGVPVGVRQGEEVGLFHPGVRQSGQGGTGGFDGGGGDIDTDDSIDIRLGGEGGDVIAQPASWYEDAARRHGERQQSGEGRVRSSLVPRGVAGAVAFFPIDHG